MQIQVTLDNLSSIKKQANISFTKDLIEIEAKNRLEQIKKKAKIPGFRPGKVPSNVIEKRYSVSVYDEVIADKIKESYVQALEELKLTPVEMPKIDIINQQDANLFSYTAVFDIYPEVDLVDFSQIKIEKMDISIQDSDVEQEIEHVRKTYANFEEKLDSDYKVVVGDKVTIDFSTEIEKDNNEKDIKHENDVEFIVGSGEMWNEFEQTLLGHSLGDSVVFSIVFPDTHIDNELIGKVGKFNVKIKKIWQMVLPEMNDDFFKKLHILDGGYDAFTDKCRKNLQAKAEELALSNVHNSIATQLIELHSFEVPSVFVEQEVERRKEAMYKDIAQQVGKDKIDKVMEHFDSDYLYQKSKKAVILTFILAKISQENNIVIDDMMVEESLKERFIKMGISEEVLAQWLSMFHGNKKYLEKIRNDLFHSKIYDLVASKAIVNTKSVSYAEALKASEMHN